MLSVMEGTYKPAIVALAGISLLLGGFLSGFLVNGWRLGAKLAEQEAEVTQLRLDVTQANLKVAAAVSTTKDELESASEKDAQHVRTQLQTVVRERDALRSASARLRNTVAAPACATSGVGAFTPAVGGAASTSALVVPAELYDRTEAEAIELGPALDEARERGLACERAADRHREAALELSRRLSAEVTPQ